jgi:hypothetical protein
MINAGWYRPLLCIACLLLPAALLAQTLTTGDITGTIQDPSGGVVPGVTIVLQNLANGATQRTVTNGLGYYRFSFLPPGNYMVTADSPDFMTTGKTTPVRVGQVVTIDIKMTIKTVVASITTTASIDVTESIPAPPAQIANLTTPVTTEQLFSLPNSGFDMTFYALLTPGVQMSTNGGFGNFSSFGLPATSNTFTINGGINNDVFTNVGNAGASGLMLGANAITEVSVVNNAYTGQYGFLAGAQVNYVSKSGGNDYHGNALYFWNGRVLNANNWFNNQAGVPRPFSNANQWAASFGGAFPKQKDKTFYFVDYEGLHVVLPTNAQAKIPSPQFAAATLANLAATGQTQAVAFYKNIFNLYASAPGAAAAQPIRGGGCGNPPPPIDNLQCALQFRADQSNFSNEYIWSIRVDHNMSDKDRIFVQFQRDNGTQATYTDPINPIFNVFSGQPSFNSQIGETHTFGPTMVNNLILTGQYYTSRFGPPSESAVLAVFPTVLNFMPQLFSNMGGIGFNFPQGRNVTQYQLIDDFSKTVGAHSFKFGVNFHRVDLTFFSFQFFQNGEIIEQNLFDFYNGGGTRSNLRQSFPQRSEAPFAYYNLGFYAQDEWRVTPQLSLTLTLRGDHNSNPVCQVNCFTNLIAPFNSLVHDPNVPYNQVIRTGLHQALFSTTRVIWQPRFGFAWTPFKQTNATVVRGGFGVFGDTFPGQIAGPMATNPPNVNSFLVNNGPITPGAPGSLFTIAAAANQSFLNGFASGGTVASITAANPLFRPPNFTTMDAPYKQARYQEWNLEVQHRLPWWDIVASVNYVGNHGTRLIIQNNGLNAFAPNFVGLPATQPDTRFRTVAQYQTGAISNYNGLVLSLRKRMNNGLLFGFGYTYSHALDEVSNAGFNPFDNQTDPSILFPQDPYNIRLYNYGNADYDARHYITANYVWDNALRRVFPKRGPELLMGGWTVAGTVFFRSGQPLTVVDNAARGALAANGFGGPIFATPIVHGYTGCGKAAANPSTPCLQIGQFAPSTTTPTGFGNQTRNQYRGPGFFDTDLSIIKNFKIPGWEGAKVGVGFEFFNLFNHPNFDKPVNDIALGQGTFGTIINTVSPPTSILGAFNGADASQRMIQLRAQFVF